MTEVEACFLLVFVGAMVLAYELENSERFAGRLANMACMGFSILFTIHILQRALDADYAYRYGALDLQRPPTKILCKVRT